jgi:hypothetical protein
MDASGKKFVYRDGVRFEARNGGLFYAPEESDSPKKYPCPDCRFCQWCADARCRLCKEKTEKEIPEGNKIFRMV